MEDIGKELLKQIKKDFGERYKNSSTIKNLLEKLKNKNATYDDAHTFAIECGKLLSESYMVFISADSLPDGRMYWNIAETILRPTLGRDYDIIVDYSIKVQKDLNKAAKLGLEAIKPALNQDKVYGIMNKVANAESFDDVAWILNDPIITFSQSVVDDTMRENVDFQARSGLHPTIKRIVMGDCCEWCASLAGTYKYPDDVPADFYRRHAHCRCRVMYNPKDGRGVQDSHTKKWFQDEAKKQARIEYSKRRSKQ